MRPQNAIDANVVVSCRTRAEGGGFGQTRLFSVHRSLDFPRLIPPVGLGLPPVEKFCKQNDNARLEIGFSRSRNFSLHRFLAINQNSIS